MVRRGGRVNQFRNVGAVKECKRLRGIGECPRECVMWRTMRRDKGRQFCKPAWKADKR
jgi:hypothetical protein